MNKPSIKDEYRSLFLSLYPSEEKRFTSKSQLIREMFDDIQEARNNNVSLVLLHDAIQQKSGHNLSYNEFKQILYRIRKEKRLNSNKKENIKTESLINKPINKNQSAITESQKESTTDNQYNQIMEKYKLCNNQIDKYIALGGKREDIEEQNISTQRSMVMNLRNKLRQKYKGIY
ncbi:hypothetical protein ACP5PY_03650 [Photobacterium leiognathi subsp. mandapamensis]